MWKRYAIDFAALGLVSLLAGCIASCASDAPDDSATDSLPARLGRSGSRLQLRGFDADGVFVLDGLYDTKLGLMCVPAVASDGVERCVPRSTLPRSPTADWEDGSVDYKGVCASELVTIPKSACADPARVVIVQGSYNASYARIGIPTFPETISSYSFGDCAVGYAPDPANDYFEPGAPMLPTDFVAFVRRDVPLSDAIHAVVLEGDDGSRVQAQDDFIDVARANPCQMKVAEDGAERCTPRAAAAYQDRMFSDADCLTPAASSSCESALGPCDESTVLRRVAALASEACVPDRYLVYVAGRRTANSVHFGSGPSECSDSVKQFNSYVEVGAPIAPTAFPLVETESKSAKTRLVERNQVIGGTVVKQAAVFDPTLDDDCSFETAADGKVRCLPAHAAVPSGRFADPTCSTPLFMEKGGCSAAPKYARIMEGAPCDPIVRIRTTVAATQAFERTSDGCVEVSSGRLFVAGEEIPAATFMEAPSTTRASAAALR